MAISVILISSDSSKKSVGTSTARVILFCTISTTIPSNVPTINSPTIPSIASTIQYTSPFVCTDSSDSDTPDIPPSPIHDTPPTDITPYETHRDRAILFSPGRPILFGRPYRYHPNGPMTHHEILCHPISDSPCDSPTAISAGLSRKKYRSPTTSVLAASPVPEALYPEPYIEPDIDPDVQANIDACIAFADDIASRGTDVIVEDGTVAEEETESSARGTIEIGVDRVTHLVVSDDTTEPVREDYSDLVSADGSLEVMQRGLDVVMKELYDYMVEILVHKVRVIETVKRDQGHRIVATSQQSSAMSEMISMLERDNMRLGGMLGVERQIVDRLWGSMLYVQRDLRRI
nr:hypothetical protein [Tanacetum cinerariifolium]